MSDAQTRVLSGQSWEDCCDALKAAGQVILRPETPVTDLDRAEGWRYLSRLTRAGLERMVEFADADFPVFYALSHETIKIGSDYPDNTYRNCIVDGAKEYRVKGTCGTAPLLRELEIFSIPQDTLKARPCGVGCAPKRIQFQNAALKSLPICGADLNPKFGPLIAIVAPSTKA